MQYDGRSELLDAAPKRLDDALELLTEPRRNQARSDAKVRHLCAAYYLAGYAVECALKVYIILHVEGRGRARMDRWGQAIEYFQSLGDPLDLAGKHSHNLGRLLTASELQSELATDSRAWRDWNLCCTWNYSARYRPDHMQDRAKVEAFVEACERTYRWMRQRLPLA